MRKAEIKRKTNEVDITGRINIDGTGKTNINTGFGPLDHLLTLFSFHGLFDLELNAKGDLGHHIIEDTGIAMGKAFKEALGNKEGINRYGCWTAVMDKVAVKTAIDISGRPSLYGRVADKGTGDFEDISDLEDIPDSVKFDDTNFTARNAVEFLEAFTQHAGLSMVYIVESSRGDLHHLLEAFFKALGKALDEAAMIDPRRKGVPSTKGVID